MYDWRYSKVIVGEQTDTNRVQAGILHALPFSLLTMIAILCLMFSSTFSKRYALDIFMHICMRQIYTKKI